MGTPTCFIRRYLDGSSVTIDLSHTMIRKIDDDINVSLTEMSTMVYGVDNRFIIDLGTTQKFTITLVRVNPPDYDDRASSPLRWSNSKWYDNLQRFFDVWQNKLQDESGETVGGYQFYFESPPDAVDLYPNINKEVFLSGTLQVSFDVGKMTLSIPLQVARMKGDSTPVSKNTITYVSPFDDDESVSYQYPTGTAVIVSTPPSRWFNNHPLFTFEGWNTSQSGTGATYQPGDVIPSLTRDMSLYATWSEKGQLAVITSSDTIDIPSGAVQVQIYAVAAGGGSGGYHGGGIYANIWHGGAGGSGASVVTVIPIPAGTKTLKAIVGKGGSGGDYSRTGVGDNGEDGEDTIVYLDDSEVIHLQGGKGGKGAGIKSSFPDEIHIQGFGGLGGVASTTDQVSGGKGGDSTLSSEAGSDGEAAVDGDVKGIAGKGAPAVISEDGTETGCGGGGASAFDYTFEGTRYASRGANADGSNTPTNGGGGARSGDGADGLVIAVFTK